MTAETHLILKLRDGRALAWREYGDLDLGFPIFYFHGNLNSRLFQPMWSDTQEQTAAAGARVIAVDRPGYGFSDFLPGRTYDTWPADIDELAQHLEIGVFAVLGYSSGGPNAMACAVAASAAATTAAPEAALAALPAMRHLAACGLVSTDGPYRQIGSEILEAMFGKTEPTLEAFTERAVQSHANMKAIYEAMSKADRKEMALSDLSEATRQGLSRGPAQDGLLECGNWSFDPADINTDCVPVLQGMAQMTVTCLALLANGLQNALQAAMALSFRARVIHSSADIGVRFWSSLSALAVNGVHCLQ
eukprot:CAMPEP_0172769864 /NCGR_PEP_ID=MMETSP1074-20121228/187449_1 /TAXON_ID=2916 /ORGANISM="Ceratium fusus, Strain PA161109" /LENGTH=304 /DNA_ID=CAMNT_0013605513 /DNA_START=31 /DNA_END=946 /DNA_ORIENTATION=-